MRFITAILLPADQITKTTVGSYLALRALSL
jgi:hypothetical protein